MLRRLAVQVIVALALGVLLLGVFRLAYGLAAPDWALGPLQLLARAVHLLTIPLRLVVNYLQSGPFRPSHATHWAGFVFTPLLYWVIALSAWRALHAVPRYLVRRLRALRRAGTPDAAAISDPLAAVPAQPAAGLTRREMLARTGLLGMGTVGLSVSAYGTYLEPGALQLREYDVPIADLPPSLDGLRIVQVADTHYGPFMTLRYLRYALDWANSLNPDLLVFNGDYVQDAHAIAPGIALFDRSRARLGMAAVLGNHDHWEGAEACRKMFQSVGIPLIDNTRLFVTATGLQIALPAGEAICLGGVGDLWCDTVSPETAFRDVPAAMPRLLLSHNPDVAEHLPSRLRVDLMLSGHTHGGQVSLPRIGAPFIASRFGKRYLGGLCQGPRCRVLVSRGVGVAGIPVRMGVPPELCHITLRRATA
jgi:predicted MPP superfamily phosphohydrolase